MNAPTNPIAACLGNGLLFIKFVPPLIDPVGSYEIQVAKTEDGIYHPYFNVKFATRFGYISGFPMLGIDIFLQLRAVSPDNIPSDWVQVARGQLLKPTTTFHCKCLRGSIIPAGAVFAMPSGAGRLVAVASVNEIRFAD